MRIKVAPGDIFADVVCHCTIITNAHDELSNFSVTGCPPGCTSCLISGTTSGTANELICSAKVDNQFVPDCVSGYTANPDGSMSCISKLITPPSLFRVEGTYELR